MQILPLPANRFLSDGGAMFGLVPKGIWQKRCGANGENQLRQRANSFLIRDRQGAWGLVDCGCGDPRGFSERERAMHGLEEDWLLRRSLEASGVSFEQIDWVFLSHAHWDHAGGLCLPDGTPTFPRARILLCETELDLALGGDPLLYKSYPQSVQASLNSLRDRIETVPGQGEELLPGIRVFSGAGHTDGQACLVFDAPRIQGESAEIPAAVFAGDNCPTQHHLRLVFQTAYDTYPLKTRAWKQEWLPRIADAGMVLLFSHDPEAYGAFLSPHLREEFVPTHLLQGTLT